MIKLEELKRKTRVNGILPGQTVELIDVERSGPHPALMTYRRADGGLDERVLTPRRMGAKHPRISGLGIDKDE